MLHIYHVEAARFRFSQNRTGFRAWVSGGILLIGFHEPLANGVFARGDGLGVTDTDRINLAFEVDNKVLLIDVRMDVRRIWKYPPSEADLSRGRLGE